MQLQFSICLLCTTVELTIKTNKASFGIEIGLMTGGQVSMSPTLPALI